MPERLAISKRKSNFGPSRNCSILRCQLIRKGAAKACARLDADRFSGYPHLAQKPCYRRLLRIDYRSLDVEISLSGSGSCSLSGFDPDFVSLRRTD